MKKHTKIYYQYFGYGMSDFVPCELLGTSSNDVHHIDCKGMGGDPNGDKDVIENLMASSRRLHIIYGDKEQYMDFLNEAHEYFMNNQEPFINVDPNRWEWDILLDTEFRDLIKQKRLGEWD